jgi:hypothetical protein
MGDETDATIQQEATTAGEGYATGDGGGMDPAILVILLLVLAFVTVTNIWLRNRAQGKPTFAALQRLFKRDV